jgi:endonuclease YncB( thermonuclease family)
LNVRLKNIDAPEIGQSIGIAARDSVAALLTNQTVQMDSFGIDMYGRTMGSIRIHGLALDSLMISKGWAWFYVPYSKDKLLPIYEAAAKARGLGL